LDGKEGSTVRVRQRACKIPAHWDFPFRTTCSSSCVRWVRSRLWSFAARKSTSSALRKRPRLSSEPLFGVIQSAHQQACESEVVESSTLFQQFPSSRSRLMGVRSCSAHRCKTDPSASLRLTRTVRSCIQSHNRLQDLILDVVGSIRDRAVHRDRDGHWISDVVDESKAPASGPRNVPVRRNRCRDAV
jgi:hypothetical protein